MIHVVIAQNWKAFNWYCRKNSLDALDRKVTIPLITFSDKYRLYGRDLHSHKLAVVGKIEEKLLNQFVRELSHYGIRVPKEKPKG